MQYGVQVIRDRLTRFEERSRPAVGVAVSIKLRVMTGCFHREHSPCAYRLIDQHIAEHGIDEDHFAFEEHESGPEIIVCLAVATAGLALAKSVVDLVTAIVEARAKGISRGDRGDSQLELIVRRKDEKNGITEEKVLRINPGEQISPGLIKRELEIATTRLLEATPPAKPRTTVHKKKARRAKRKK